MRQYLFKIQKGDAQKTISFVNLPENGIKWALVFR
jgi:hypothetical protein